jgi:hypothetical protein
LFKIKLLELKTNTKILDQGLVYDTMNYRVFDS